MHEKAIQALDTFYSSAMDAVAGAVRSLLECKHIYQRLAVPFDGLVEAALSTLSTSNSTSAIAERMRGYVSGPWEPLASNNLFRVDHARANPRILYFMVPNAYLFCAKCDSKEAFNWVDHPGLGSCEALVSAGQDQVGDDWFQTFVLSLQCQKCRGVPEVFLVRREKNKLVLCGRAPIEKVEVPSEVPKEVARFFSDAVTEFNSGQVLAANFLLRTVVEQRAYRVAEQKGSPGLPADKALDVYVESLDAPVREQFPSPRKVYSDLSDDIHAAVGSESVFETARDEILEHFRACKLFAERRRT